MKTEMVKYSAMKEASQAVAALFSGAYGTANGGSRAGTVSRSGGMFSGEKISLEALAESYEQEKQTWSRTLSGTLALLEKATIMVEQAEQRIVEQEDRIALLEDVVTTDELTALKNRRGFLEAFVAEIDRCNRTISNAFVWLGVHYRMKSASWTLLQGLAGMNLFFFSPTPQNVRLYDVHKKSPFG